MPPMPAFQLTKWYADVLDPATGELAICYDSELRWRGLALRFTNLLRFAPPATRRASASFRPPATADLNPNHTEFTLRQRGAHGTWQRQAPALHELLLETEHGSVLWECVFPAATATLTLPDTVLHGRGYAEKLTLTLPPWHLPIQTLRWGRFVAPGHWLVWIRWDGPEPRNLLYYNGQRHADTGHIGDEEVRCGPLRLALTNPHSLRAGAVGKTVFQRFPWFQRLFPARILRLNEAKWLSAATLWVQGAVVATGHAVHERVEWPP